MAITKATKQSQLAALEAKFKDAKGVAFVRFDGLTVEEAQTTRRALRADGMTYTVIKKTLISLAAKNTGLAEFDSDQLDGAVAVIVSTDDEIAPAAAIKNMIKDFNNAKAKVEKVDYAGAIFEGKFVDAEETKQLASIPSKEESFGKIVGMLTSGPQKIHGVLNSGFQGLYNVMQNAEKFAK